MNVAGTILNAQTSINSKPTAPMIAARRHLVRSMVDAVAAFALFAIASMTLASAPSSASPTPMSRNATGPSIVVQAKVNPAGTMPFQANSFASTGAMATISATGSQTAWVLLGLAISLLAAINLALIRHLREAYSHPRRRH